MDNTANDPTVAEAPQETKAIDLAAAAAPTGAPQTDAEKAAWEADAKINLQKRTDQAFEENAPTQLRTLCEDVAWLRRRLG